LFSVSRATASALLALALLLGLQRWRTRDEPLDRDVATYALIGQELLHGRQLYTDLFDHKPPLQYGAFAAAQLVAGPGAGSIYLLGLACGLSTLLAVFVVGCAAGGSPGVGLLAAAFWVIVGGDLRLQANLPNGEALINALLPWALAALVGGSRRARLLAAGCAIALASLVKPFIAIYAVSLPVAFALAPRPGRTRFRALREALAIPLTVAGAWLLVGAYFWASGRFGDLWKALVVYNAAYAGGLWQNLLAGLSPTLLLPEFLRPQLPLVTLAAVGAVLSLFKRPLAPALINLVFLATTLIAVAAPGKFFPHYYQLWLPPLCITAALGLGLPLIANPWRLAGAGAAVQVLLGLIQAPSYALGPDEWSRQQYGDVFVKAARTGEAIDRLLATDETFYQWGIDPSLYFYARRRPPVGALWSQHLLEGPLRLELRQRTLEQLSARPPELVVVWRVIGPPRGALGDWFREHYATFPPPIAETGFSFWYRKGGVLEERLRREGRLRRSAD